MYDDIESDFWKEKFVHLLHKNMVRTNAEKLFLSDADNEFNKFAKKHPDYNSEITNSTSYVTWEIFVTTTIKLRLFIQSQIKGSLLQIQNNDLVKIADAKFPYNPFPEIEEFLQHKNDYLNELEEVTKKQLKFKKQQKLTGEMIKALLMQKFNNTEICWHLETTDTDFNLIISEKNGEKQIPISMKNFAAEIKAIIPDSYHDMPSCGRT